jgi:hypothetical protein
MATRIKLRRDTSANWIINNPVLAQGETGFETDTRAMKLGDGITRWADLKYAVTGDLKITDSIIHGDSTVSISSGMGEQTNWVMTIHTNDGIGGDATDPVEGHISSVGYDSHGNIFSSGGYDLGPIGKSGMFLIKTDPNGEVIFHNYYDQYYAFGWAMIVDNNDDVVFVMGEYDASSVDTVLVKVSGTDGTIMWQKYLADTDSTSDDIAICVDIDPLNNIIIAGSTATSSNIDFWVAKFSGSSGNSIWQKQYDQDMSSDNVTGLAVDSQGNIGIVGSTYGGENTYLPVFKLSGEDGSILWQSKIVDATMDGNNVWMTGRCYSADICADSNDDFYFNLTGVWCNPWVVAGTHKVKGTDGSILWGKVVTYKDFFNNAYYNGASSVICDDENNVYALSILWGFRQQNQENSTGRWSLNVTKFNATGSKVWSRSLDREQASQYVAGSNPYQSFGQCIAVRGDNILIGGTQSTRYAYDYGDNPTPWFDYPFIAQLDRAGTEFNVDGWHFHDSDYRVYDITLVPDVDGVYLNDLTELTADIVVSTGDVAYDASTDTTQLSYVNRNRVKTMTLEGAKLKLPENGTLELSRAHKGYVTAIGNFDGLEGGNTDDDVWLNASVRDQNNNTYAAGGQYTYWNNSGGKDVSMVYKTDSTGKLLWQAGTALDQYSQNYGIAYDQTSNTIVAVGTDGELDGHEGFNLIFLNADTGSMKQDIIHIRPNAEDNDIYPHSVKLMSNGSPVVTGYISGSTDIFANVTAGANGSAGSTSTGTLVVAKTIFEREGYSTEYPLGDGTWYINGSSINHVNHFGDDESFTYGIAYTGTLGNGAVFTISVTSGAWVVNLDNGGSGYKAGQRIKLLGSDLGGTSPTNDLYLFVSTVDGSGAITDLTGDTVADSIPSDGGPYTPVPAVSLPGDGVTGWVNVNPITNTYGFNINSPGQYYGVGDTLKILGSDLGGANVTNDMTITVTAINDVGVTNGQINTFTVGGNAQTASFKMYVSDMTDYTLPGTYDIIHELSNDAFIWTPTWNVSLGGSSANSYDSIHGLAIDANNSVIVSGYTEGTGLSGGTTWNGNNQTGFIAKYSSTGENLWAVSIDGNEGASTVWSVDVDADDNIYSAMTNQNAEDLYVTKITTDGDLVWQLALNMWNSHTYSLGVTDNGDILVVGEVYIEEFDNEYHNYNNNVIIVKFDSDGNLLFSRALWSQNGVQFNRNDWVSNQLTIKGDRFSFVGYSRDPGGEAYQGIMVDLPIDGTGTGMYGDFHYDEIEIDYHEVIGLTVRFYTNDLPYGDGILTPITLTTRAHEFVNEPYTDDILNVTMYDSKSHEIQTISEPGGADITGVAKIVFADGTEQTTTGQGLPQVKMSQVNGDQNDYWIRPEDNGKHIFMLWYSTVIIPEPDLVDLPVGFAFTIITSNNDCGVYSWNSSEDIYGSGMNGDNNNSWTIPAYSMVTLVKVHKEDNNYSGRWMIAGPGISTGWW